jgi:hypothetical protein
MSKRFLGLFLLAGLLLPVAAKAGSVTPAWEFTSPSQYTNGDWTFGEVFTANQNIGVGYLGYYDPSGGMFDSHEVGLYTSSGSLLAFTTVTNTSAFSSPDFLYNAITPVELIAGQTYVIEGVSGTDLYTYQVTGLTAYLPITILGTNNPAQNAGLAFEGTSLLSATYTDFFGADFAPTPEPGSFLLLGSGLAALAGIIRRKRTALKARSESQL